MAADHRAVPAELSSAPADARLTTARATADTFADVAAFSVLVSAAVAVPLIFSTAQSDVFALPKTATTLSLAALLLVLLGVRVFAGGVQVPAFSPLTAAVTTFVVWSLVAWVLAIEPSHALLGEQLQFQGLATNVSYVVFLILGLVTVRGPWRTSAVLAALASGGIVVVAYGLLQRAGLDPIWSSLPQDRIFSTLGQANALSAYLVLLVPLIVALAVGRRPAVQLALLSFAALALLALLFTMSRGGYLAIGVVGLVLLASVVAWRRSAIQRRHVIAALLVVVATLAVAATIPPVRSVAERVAARALLGTDLAEGSTRMKLDLWAVSLAMAADHPLDGVGQDGYVLVFPDYRDHVLPADRGEFLARFRPESPHNVYLGLLNGGGIPLLAAYVAIVAIVGARVVRSLRFTTDPRAWFVTAAIAAALAGHLVTDVFMTAETTTSMLFWTLLGVAAAGAGSATAVARGRGSQPVR